MSYYSIVLQYSVWTDAAKTHCRHTQQSRHHTGITLHGIFQPAEQMPNERRRIGWWRILPRRGTMESVSPLASNYTYTRPIHRLRTRFLLIIILSPFATFLFYNNILSVFPRRNQTRGTRLSITIVNRRRYVNGCVSICYLLFLHLFFIFTSRVTIDDHNKIIITTLFSWLLLLLINISSVFLLTISY